MRQFGRGEQIAPLLRRLTGVRDVSLAECTYDAIPWQELKRLQHLRQLTLPLASIVGAMAPLRALQQLTALTLTSCEYGVVRSDWHPQLVQTAELPATVLAELVHLVALDASGCGPLPAAGLERLTALQQLEVLRVPWDDAEAVTQLAARLQRLRSLDLRCCPVRCCAPEEAHKGAAAPLDLTAATALTQLRLHMCGGAAETAKHLQMPPQLQALHVAIVINVTHGNDDVMALINALPLQHLVSLMLCHKGEDWPSDDDPPLVALRLPDKLPRLTHLCFGSYTSWDMYHEALWPLAVLAARTAEGDHWRFQVRVGEVLEYQVAAADILQPEASDAEDIVNGVLCGRLTSACFEGHDCLAPLHQQEEVTVEEFLGPETQLTRLILNSYELVEGSRGPGFVPAVKQLSSLTALRQLDAM